MRLPSEEDIAAKMTYLQSLVDSSEGGIVSVDIHTIESMFTASGHADWIGRLAHDKSGHELLAALPGVPIVYLASWWLFEEMFDRISSWLTLTFGTYELKERQLAKIRIELSSSDDTDEGVNESKSDPSAHHRRPLGDLFGAVEAVKEELNIQDYSIAQTSLEQIFNQFAALDSGNV